MSSKISNFILFSSKVLPYTEQLKYQALSSSLQFLSLVISPICGWRMMAIGQNGGMGYGKEGRGMGYWCSLTRFCSYKHTTKGDDLLITFVFPSSLLPA
jgi:hypothetical protein